MKVLFRKQKSGDIIAILPEEHSHKVNEIVTYESTIGFDHANYDIILEQTKPASDEEYYELLNELEEYYNIKLQVLTRLNKVV